MNVKTWMFVLFSVLLINCGSPEHYSSLTSTDIVNGIEMEDSEMPAIVQILFAANGANAKCSAVFVSPNTMLTAAHCTEISGHLSKKIKIETGQAVGTESLKILRHPNYRWNTIDHDVAVVIFPERTANDFMYVADKAPVKNDRVMIVGYGRTEFDRPAVENKKRKGWNTIERIDSRLTFFSKPDSRNLPGEDACSASGDSGGPMLVNEEIVGLSSTISRSRSSGVITGNYANLFFTKHMSFLKNAITQHGAEIRGIDP